MPNLGIAKVRVARRDERSVVTQQFGKAPLQVHRPLYLDGEAQPTIFLKTPSSGLLGGDEHELTVHVENNASLLLRTQACTLVYPGKSQQRINITLDDDASLVFQPHALILAKNAELTQTITITVGSNCNLLISDHWCAGRIAMNERWQFKQFNNTITIQSCDQLIYREHWILEPENVPLQHPLLCGEFVHFKNSYATGSLSIPSAAEDEAIRIWTLSKTGYALQRIASRTTIESHSQSP